MTDIQALERLSPERKRLLAERLRMLRGNRTDMPVVERRPDPRAPAPLSYAQERLWFLETLSPGTALFNVPAVIPLPFAADESVLRRCLAEIVRRHEALRTAFRSRDGVPEQIILEEATPEFRVIDLSALAADERAARARALAQHEAQQPFDLEQGCLLRCVLLRLARNDALLLMTLHHIAADGWSLGILLKELGDLYRAFALSQPSPLQDLPIQYADFAVWQRQWLRGTTLERHLAYWRERLQDIVALDLPTDRPRPVQGSGRGDQVPLRVPAPVTARLRELARAEGCTLFMVCLAIFLMLLNRYTRQTDVTIGTYIANRNYKDLESLIGFFVNTLALRVDLSGDPSLIELIGRVRDCTTGAYEHQDMPFPRLIEALQPARDLSRNPLFQVVFHLFNAPTLQIDAAAAEDGFKGERQTAIFDLVAQFFDTPRGLVGGFEYATDLFDRETISRMAQHYASMLDEATQHPDRPMSKYALLNPAERRRLLVDWNDTKAAYDSRSRVAETFANVARDRGPQTAFRHRDEIVSYSELQAQVERLTLRLHCLGVGKGCRIGLGMERSAAVAAAMLATWRLGAVFVPLDPSYPRERLQFILADSGLTLVLVDDGSRDVFAGLGARLADVHGAEGTGAVEAAGAEPPDSPGASPDDPACIFYTSGSSGRPKGILLKHRQILNRLNWMWSTYPLIDGETCCQRTALNFIDMLWEYLGALLQGCPTLIVPDTDVRDLDRFGDILARERVTRLWLVPSLLQAIVDAFPDLGERLPDLLFWVSTGEPLTRAQFDRFAEVHPDATLYNLYGTTEVWDATWHDPSVEPVSTGPVPIGRPIANVRTYVLDEHLRPVPVGVHGMLFVGGDGLCEGYLDRPALTAERFLPSPFAPGERLYQTGDIARYLADGRIQLVGRADNQIKLRGFRIELGEIEAVIAQHPQVRTAVVVARTLPNGGGTALGAFVVAEEGSQLTAEGLRDHLRLTLPDHALPASIAFLPALPMTPNGKADRLALPADGRGPRHSPPTAPRMEEEERLRALFADLLGRKPDEVGIFDDFFGDLGGHSLLAARIVSRIRDRFSIDLPLRTIFERPTVASMAEYLRANAGQSPARTGTIPKASRDRYLV